MSQTTKSNVAQLFQGSVDDGSLTPQALAALNVGNIAANIQQGMGIDPNDIQSSDVTLVTMMPDDSGSIDMAGQVDTIIAGCNDVLDALDGAKGTSKDGILVHNRYLNGNILYPYCLLGDAVRMSRSNYDANGGTPLYDQTRVLLAAVLAKKKEMEEAMGVPVRAVTLIVTDGLDEHSHSIREPEKLAPVIRDMLKTEMHIIAAMGIGDDKAAQDKFRDVFTRMGIDSKWILTPKSSQKEIRAAFRLFSQSAVKASQGAQGFSQTVQGGGFGSP